MSRSTQTLGGVATGVHWVRGALEHNLRQVMQGVEQHAEARRGATPPDDATPPDRAPLDSAVLHLQEVRGVAVMVQAYAVALLAEELKQTLQELAAGSVREPTMACGAVISACLQAVDYLDLLEHGHDDCVLVLQPIICELRLVRGKPLATEDELFVAQFRALGLVLARPTPALEGDAKAEAARLSPMFSAALLCWFKEQDTASSLARIGRIAEVMSGLCRKPALHQLWRTAAACVEALLSGTLDPSLELKRQFGRAGQLLKILAESGEAAAAKQVSDVSLRLLFHAGRSRGAGQRVAFLRQSLALETWLPPVDVIQARRAQLRSASTQLLARVVEELRADLAQVRDHIDLALRSDADEQDFGITARTLKRVADTLLMLGLTAESQALAAPVETLRDSATSRPADTAMWMEFATAVLQVDLSLEGALYRQLQTPVQISAVHQPALSADLREGVSALLRESLVNLQQIKTQVETWIEAGDSSGLHEATRLLDEIAAGLSMLGLAPAAELVQRVRRFVAGAEFSGLRSTESTARGFADALAAIEYFIEFRRGRSPAAHPALDRLAAIVAGLPQAQPASIGAGTALAPDPVPLQEKSSVDDTDAEIRSVFVDEAREVLNTLDETLPRWRQQIDDRELLAIVRRGFHTLKGSGHMVGAQEIGDLARAVEHLLNGCLEGTVECSDAIVDVVRRALDVLPGMVQAFSCHEPASQLAAAIAGRARELVATTTTSGLHELGAFDSPLLEGEGPGVRESEQEALAAEEPDPELLAVFAPEARELLEALHDSLNTWREVPANAVPARVMQRDLHSFKGGARMAGLLGLGDAAHALETRLVALERRNTEPDSGDVQDIGVELARLEEKLEEVLVARVGTAAPGASMLGAESETSDSIGIGIPAGDTSGEPAASAANWDPQLFWRPGHEEAAALEARREAVRVPVERLDRMLNQAGEISTYRSRLEESHALIGASLSELSQTLARVREQLRLMDIENEAQIAARRFAQGDGAHRYESQFDPLEMDRYSRMQELSRSLNEGVSDLGALHASLDTAVSEAEGLLQSQGRINTEVQQALMGSLMVPFSGQVPRLTRVVRQTAEQNARQARAEFTGVESELDRNMLERMTAPLEHLLRNAVVHGVEDTQARLAAGKPAEGLVQVELKREGSQLLIEVRDDGRGLDYPAIRANAITRGLIREIAQVTDEDLARLVFTAGFSTATTLTQDAGRGIGMDVVAAEVKQLGGSVDVASETGKGVRVRIRLPLMLAVSQALVVQIGSELFAVPLPGIEGVVRIPCENLGDLMRESGQPLTYAGKQYPVRWLADLVDLAPPGRIETRSVPAILMRLGSGPIDDAGGAERRVAVVAERLIGNREIVAKAAGPILSSVPGITGATSLSDGRVMLIIDIHALIEENARRRLSSASATPAASLEEARRLILVVDDSVTIRRVTERLLNRKGFAVITAKDGLDAMALLQTETPAAMLLDIEMPRADGFEVAAYVRNSARLARLPIVMITSRSSDKHRQHAQDLGVDRYLTKPFQEDQLLGALREVLESAEKQLA